jgi:hypothetical protein
MTVTEAIGLTAAALAGYAYVPQISHLARERCSAGLSERAFTLWLGSSVLMTIHAVSIGSGVFVVLGLQQVGCTGVVAFFCRRYRGQRCPSHDGSAQSKRDDHDDVSDRHCRGRGQAPAGGQNVGTRRAPTRRRPTPSPRSTEAG